MARCRGSSCKEGLSPTEKWKRMDERDPPDVPPANLIRRFFARRNLDTNPSKRPHRCDHERSEDSEQVSARQTKSATPRQNAMNERLRLVNRHSCFRLVVLVMPALAVRNTSSDLGVKHSDPKCAAPASPGTGRQVGHGL